MRERQVERKSAAGTMRWNGKNSSTRVMGAGTGSRDERDGTICMMQVPSTWLSLMTPELGLAQSCPVHVGVDGTRVELPRLVSP